MSTLNYVHPFISLKFHELYKAFLLQVETDNGGLTWWGALLILGLIILVVVLAIAWNASKTTVPEVEHPILKAQETVAPLPTPALAPDDLAVIEGIGPKIASLLQENGITTFDRLAHADLTELQAILQKAGLRIADPTTWPEQAELAAKADWAALEALQGRLKAGRK